MCISGPSAPSPVKFQPSERNNGQASGGTTFVGDVGFVIAGNTPTDVLKKVIDCSPFRYGFEAGTVAPVGDDSALGEMVAFNGHAYVRSTRVGTSEY